MPNSSFVLPVTELLRNPQVPQYRECVFEIPESWETEYASYLAESVGADVSLTASDGGILASVSLPLQWTAQCSRCATDFVDTLEVSLNEYYTTEAKVVNALSEGDEEASEWPTHDGFQIDLEPRLREEAILALPLLPLCDSDCEGLCPDCGFPYEELEADHSHEEIDPRFAKLQMLFKGNKDGQE
ncbi:DUF177 domain-containing protein [Actinomycetaceae bacterium TAE3-ERU4]|nr:DUF177 domain-containing protein [Actinomycetaceae bacterium TAE3-ERU4]